MLNHQGQDFSTSKPKTGALTVMGGEGGGWKEDTQIIKVMKICVSSLPSGENMSCAIV